MRPRSRKSQVMLNADTARRVPTSGDFYEFSIFNLNATGQKGQKGQNESKQRNIGKKRHF